MVDKFRKIFFVFAIVAISLMGMPVHTAKAATVSAGSLIKASGAAVYYYASNGKRYVFPNEKTYMTWFSDFSSVVTITDAELAAIQIGGNIVYRPGTRLVKITTDPKVYAVSAHGTLHWITSETLANQLYGATWNQMIDDVSDAFFTNYTYGADITSAVHPDGAQIKYAGSANIYVIEGGEKRLIADAAAYSANRFNSAYVMNIADTITYASAATSLAAAEVRYTDVAQLWGTSTPVVTGNLNVTVAADTPASTTVPQGAIGVAVAKFTLTAGSAAVNVDALTLTRSGLGMASDISKVYLYNGDAKLGSGRTINTSTNTVNFTNLGLSVPANGSVTITVKVDIAAVGSGGTHRFGVDGVGAVTSSASVGGIFPVNANEFAVSTAVTVGTVEVDSAGSGYTRKVGETNVEIANFTVYMGNAENGQVESITLYNSGRDIVNNLTLYRGTTLVATATKNGSYFTFNLTTPYEIAKSESAQFTVKGDVNGRNGDTATLSIRYKTDVRVKGMTYGYALSIDEALGTALQSYVEEGATLAKSNTVTAEAGQLTAAFNGPVASEVAKNTNDVVLMNFSLTAQAATDVEKTTINIAGTNLTTVLGVAEIDDLELVCNNVVVTEWSTVTIGNNVSTDIWTLPAGGVNCQVRIDVLNTTAGDETITASLVDLSTAAWTFKDAASGDTLTDIVPSGDIVGNEMGITAASLAVVKSSTPAAGTVNVAGSSEVATNGFIFTAGAATAVDVTSIKLNAYLDADASDALFVGANDKNQLSGAKDVISAVRLYEDNSGVLTQVGTAKSLVVGTTDITVTFSDLNWNIPAGASKKLVVKADISSSAPICVLAEAGVDGICGTPDDVAANQDYIAFDIATGNVTAEYGSGTALSNVPAANVNNVAPYIYQTIVPQGTLSVALDADTPVADLVLMGGNKAVSKFKFSATNEDIRVEKLQIKNNDILDPLVDDDSAAYVSVTLNYTNSLGNAASSTQYFSGDVANFSGLDIKVPKDGSTIVTVTANYNTKTGGAVDSTETGLDLDWDTNFRAVTLGSGQVISTVGAADVAGNHMRLYESYPTIDFGAIPGDNSNAIFNAAYKIATINVTANGNQDVTFDGAALNFINIDLSVVGGLAAGDFVWITDGTNTLCDAAGDALAGTAGDNVFTCAFNVNSLVVAKNTTKTLHVFINAVGTGLGAGDSIQPILMEGLGNIGWSINLDASNNDESDIIFRGNKYGSSFYQQS